MLEAKRGLVSVVEIFDLPRSATGGEGERETERGTRQVGQNSKGSLVEPRATLSLFAKPLG